MANKTPIVEAVEEAVDWIRRMRREGAVWELLPRPSVPELYPNMSNANTGEMMRGADTERDIGDEDGEKEQWDNVKRWLADEIGELTLLRKCLSWRRAAIPLERGTGAARTGMMIWSGWIS